MSALQPAEVQELAWAAGLHLPRAEAPLPRIRRRLQAKSLMYSAGGVTPLGRATVELGGHVLDALQQQLVIALAEGSVRSSNSWALPSRAPAAALRRLEEIGVARGRLHGGTRMYDATSLGHRVAVILRQQTLPPPGRASGGGEAMTVRRCRECGCTEDRACVDYWGDACAWSERDPTLCSFCDEGVPCDPGGPPPTRAAFAGAGAQGVVRGAP